ncbi:MAG: hypothetical protein M1816_006317 [Peltula sp. TS41687]|nr:MAG: hypothetical protein M1816_006317 [Peltula sp. TS41687]
MNNDLVGMDDPSTIESSALDISISQPDPQGDGSLLQGTDGNADVGDFTGVGDTPMIEVTDPPQPTTTIQSPPEPSPTPQVISDNPLDAPDAPRPQDEIGIDNENENENDNLNDNENDDEDENMGDVGDEAEQRKEIDSPEKDNTEGIAPTTSNRSKTDQQPAQTKASIEASARSHLISQTHSIILPSYSTWFDMHTIHPLEKKALPEFFNNRNRSKTPVVYKDYRDFMINTYRLNPNEYLTVTACRRNLAGDVCAIMRVHAFLEQWGLINYQVDPETRPSNIGPPFTGHFRIVADSPRGLQPFQPGPNSVVTSGRPFAGTDRAVPTSSTSATADLNLEIRRNIYDQSGKELTSSGGKPDTKETNGEGSSAVNGASGSKSIEDLAKEPRKQYNCHVCGNDCTRIRYHTAKSLPPAAVSASPSTIAKVKYDICPNCFHDGRFPRGYNAFDFLKLEDPSYSSIPDKDAPWTDAEVLLLLEGLELFDEDWKAISEHVGTRTREECVLKFLSLEIDDKYMNNDSTTAVNSGTLGLLAGGGRAPFSQADNPVMSVVAFLASLSNQEVAAAAAGRTVEEMRRSLRESLEKSNNTGEAQDGQTQYDEKGNREVDASNKESQDVKDGDSMDVDKQIATRSAEKQPQSASSLATIPLAVTAARAAGLASHEERETLRLVSSAVNVTLQRLELKLAQFNEMEAIIQAERRELERGRQQLFLDRLAFRNRVDEVTEAFKSASLRAGLGGDEAAQLAREVGDQVGFGKLTFRGGEVEGASAGIMGEGGSSQARQALPVSENTPGWKGYDV